MMKKFKEEKLLFNAIGVDLKTIFQDIDKFLHYKEKTGNRDNRYRAMKNLRYYLRIATRATTDQINNN